MKKYSIKNITDYIQGNEIKEFDIETLEDNYEFMIDVIKLTKDKNMYDLCSENVKNNYEFIIFMINTFKKDLDFILKISNNYLKNSNNKLNCIELQIIINDLINADNMRKDYLQYKLLAMSIYSTKKYEISLILEQLKNNDEIINALGEGFCFILDGYSGRDIIVNFFAQKYIDEIISKVNLLDSLQQRFKSSNELEEYGINNFLIELLTKHDPYLGYYVSNHLDLLNETKKEIESIKVNWQYYYSLMEYKKYNLIISTIHEYMEKYGEECSFLEVDILFYISNELGIKDKILKYDYSNKKYFEYIVKDFELHKKEMSFLDWVHFNKIKSLIISIFNKNNNSYEDNIIENKKTKILNINFNQKKKTNN